jgi:adenylate kinase family enzyme
VTQVEEGADGSKFGYILRGFPFNTQQALLLDRYLNGVNLAIHLRSPADSTDYESSIKPLLNYYDERVSNR